ncbi:DUF3868 domain-containing protein [Dysgonomonas massiliensis]|uniref:DUF3868 domain-containing protein n=1 Tax=Dysgonomonas massiliensis TaxID=2040292 RepID=UPI000C78D219|nr:DUF3868 domain-containing protein [Dysgonomonas massiliensis]
MKTILIYIVVLFAALPTVLYAQAEDCCKGAIQVQGKEFSEKDGKVYVKFSIQIANKDIDSRASIRLTPEILALNNNEVLPSVLIYGKARKKLNNRWLSLANDKDKNAFVKPKIEYTVGKKAEETIDYEVVIPYESWMDASNLVINQEVIGCAQKMNLHNYKLYTDLLTGPREPYIPELSLSYVVPEKEKIKKRDFQGKAFLDFPVGSSIILADFRNNPAELAKINEDINKVNNNSDLELVGLKITGYASPEGSYAGNEKLSIRRTDALKKYLESIFKFSNNQLTTSSVAEDWIGFREAIAQGNDTYKDDILAIIDSRDTYDKKEQRLKALAGGVPYQRVLKDIFPSLRRVEYQVDYTVRDYNVEESKQIYGKEAKNLSELELFNLARTYTKGGKEYMHIMTVLIPQNFPTSETANQNAFAALLENGELDKAKQFLDKIPYDNMNNLNNKGTYYLKTGDLDQAESLFKQAQQKGSNEAALNLKEVLKKREDNKKHKRID